MCIDLRSEEDPLAADVLALLGLNVRMPAMSHQLVVGGGHEQVARPLAAFSDGARDGLRRVPDP